MMDPVEAAIPIAVLAWYVIGLITLHYRAKGIGRKMRKGGVDSDFLNQAWIVVVLWPLYAVDAARITGLYPKEK